MKTTTYKIGNAMRTVVASLIILASLQGIAKAGNAGKGSVETIKSESALTVGSLMIHNEYNAKEFVEAEMALEIQNWTNSNSLTNNDLAGSEPELLNGISTDDIKYNAEEFVKAEMAREIEKWDKCNQMSRSKGQTICRNELANN